MKRRNTTAENHYHRWTVSVSVTLDIKMKILKTLQGQISLNSSENQQGKEVYLHSLPYCVGIRAPCDSQMGKRLHIQSISATNETTTISSLKEG